MDFYRMLLSERLSRPGDRRPKVSKTDIAFDLFPQARLPPIDIQEFIAQCRDGHRRIGWQGFVRGNIFRSHFKLALFAVTRLSQTIDGKAKVWQHVVIDDVVEKHGVRIEGFFRQKHAIVKGLVAANRSIPREN